MIFQTCGCIAVDSLWLLFTQYKTIAYHYQQSLSHCIIRQDICLQQQPATCAKTRTTYLEVNHLIVNAIKTNSRRIRSQVRPHNGAYVNCKYTTELLRLHATVRKNETAPYDVIVLFGLHVWKSFRLLTR